MRTSDTAATADGDVLALLAGAEVSDGVLGVFGLLPGVLLVSIEPVVSDAAVLVDDDGSDPDLLAPDNCEAFPADCAEPEVDAEPAVDDASTVFTTFRNPGAVLTVLEVFLPLPLPDVTAPVSGDLVPVPSALAFGV